MVSTWGDNPADGYSTCGSRDTVMPPEGSFWLHPKLNEAIALGGAPPYRQHPKRQRAAVTRRSPVLQRPPLPPEGPTGPGHRAQRLAPLNLLHLPAILLSIAFTGQRLLDPELLPRLQVKRVSLDFPDYVFLQDFPLEPLERVLERLTLLEPYLCQIAPPMLTRTPSVRADTFSITCCFVILSKFTCFGSLKPAAEDRSLELRSVVVRRVDTKAYRAAASSLRTASSFIIDSHRAGALFGRA